MRITSFRAEGEESPRPALLLPERDELLDLGSDACGIDAPASHLGWFDLDGAPLARARALPTAVTGPGEPVVIPPGVGFARNPPVWLRPGDVMEVEIEGLGVLRSPVVGFQAPA